MLQVTINIVYDNILYLFSFTYSYVFVSQAIVYEGIYNLIFLKKWVYYLKQQWHEQDQAVLLPLLYLPVERFLCPPCTLPPFQLQDRDLAIRHWNC